MVTDIYGKNERFMAWLTLWTDLFDSNPANATSVVFASAPPKRQKKCRRPNRSGKRRSCNETMSLITGITEKGNLRPQEDTMAVGNAFAALTRNLESMRFFSLHAMRMLRFLHNRRYTAAKRLRFRDSARSETRRRIPALRCG